MAERSRPGGTVTGADVERARQLAAAAAAAVVLSREILASAEATAEQADRIYRKACRAYRIGRPVPGRKR